MTRALIKAGVILMLAASRLIAEEPMPTEQTMEKLPAHPRLFLTPDRLHALQARVKADPVSEQLANGLRSLSEKLLDEPPVTYQMTGRRLLSVSRDALRRIGTLAMTFQLTGDKRFAQRAIAEMEAVCAFDDWNPKHFLDTGEMTLAVAIGYDWLYDQLTPEQRQTIEAAILEKGLNASYEQTWWVSFGNNWNQVCHAGMVAGAIALADQQPELAAKVVQRAIENVPIAAKVYAPDGACIEGPTYWSYGCSFHVLLIDELEAAFGSSFGLAETEGFMASGVYRALVIGPTGQLYNYADANEGGSPNVEEPIFWFAKRLDQPMLSELVNGDLDVAMQRFDKVKKHSERLMPFALLWAEPVGGSNQLKLPLHWQAGGPNPISLHRTAWNDPTATFVGFKGGKAGVSHGHMDAGSFIMEAQGVRWAIELGMPNYAAVESHGVALFDGKQDSQRWDVFGVGVKSHNILVFDDHRQQVAGDTHFIRFSDDATFPHAVVDVTNAYTPDASTVRRGVGFIDKQVLVQDEFTTKQDCSVAWQMLTNADVTQDDAGIVLKQNGQTLRLTVLDDAAFEFTCTEAEDLLEPFDDRAPNTRRIRLTMQAVAGQAKTFRVLLSPSDAAAPVPAIKPLADWSEPLPAGKENDK